MIDERSTCRQTLKNAYALIIDKSIYSQGFGRKCGASGPVGTGLTDGQKASIVSAHNSLRSKVATGAEGRGSPGPQPPAADMMEMTWDDELASVAQRWADQCQFGHDTSRDVDRFQVIIIIDMEYVGFALSLLLSCIMSI